MAFSTVFQAGAFQTLAHGSISSSYAAVGNPIGAPARMVRLINNTDGDMIFSMDGATDMFFVPAASYVLYDCGANTGVATNSPALRIRGGTQFYVRQSSAPTKNSVYVEYIYAYGEV